MVDMTMQLAETIAPPQVETEYGALVRDHDRVISAHWGFTQEEIRTAQVDAEICVGGVWVELLEIRTRPTIIPETVIWKSGALE